MRSTGKRLLKLPMDCHRVNKANGFWEKDEPRVKRRMLIVSEIGELIEAMRTKQVQEVSVATQNAYYLREIGNNIEANKSKYHSAYKTFLKGTIEEEFADVAIRIFDYCCGFSIPILLEWYYNENEKFAPILDEEEVFVKLERLVLSIINEDFATAFMLLRNLCYYYNIDLVDNIILKNIFNSTRGYMHGKQF